MERDQMPNDTQEILVAELEQEAERVRKGVYWRVLLDKCVPRGKPGDFHLSGGRCVIDVAQSVHLEFAHWSGLQRWTASAGDVVFKGNRRPNGIESELFRSLGGSELDYVTIGKLYDDDDALNTALRANLRHVLRSIGGRRERVRNHWVMIPGKIQLVIDELEREHLKAQYRGMLAKCRELRRIQRKIEGGFRAAHHALLEMHDDLKHDEVDPESAAVWLRGLTIHLGRTVASVKPYSIIAADAARIVDGMQSDKNAGMRIGILRVDATIEKAWRGTRVQPEEIHRAGRRYRE